MTRQELADSREVMREQAEQAKKQAIQAQRQADFIGEQTENLKRQAEDYYREKQDRIFEETLRAFHKTLIPKLGLGPYKIPTGQGLVLVNIPDFRQYEHEKAIFEICKLLKGLEDSLRRLAPTATWPVPGDALRSILEGLEPLVAMESQLSPAGQIKLTSLELKSGRASILEILRMQEEHDRATIHNQ